MKKELLRQKSATAVTRGWAAANKRGLGLLVAAAVLLLGGCWWLTMSMAADFARGSSIDWRHASLFVLFAMWAVMMAAMMLPAAIPFLRLLSQCAVLQTRHSGAASPNVAASVMVTAAAVAYLLMWLLFSIAAAGLQAWLAASLDSKLAVSQPLAQAALLAAIGGYQLSPLKFACLRGCRPPPLFLLLHWRRGIRGAFVMGGQHGLFCLGCCWALMLLLFVGGIMNLWWILGLTCYALVEKTAPPSALIPITRLSGAALLLAAVMVLGS